jgi:hypothetical protein
VLALNSRLPLHRVSLSLAAPKKAKAAPKAKKAAPAKKAAKSA